MAKLIFALAIGIVLALPTQADTVALINKLAPNIRPSVVEEAVNAMHCAQSHGVGPDASR